MATKKISELAAVTVPAGTDEFEVLQAGVNKRGAASLYAAPATLLTTRGDLIRRGASAPERVALGPSGHVWTSDGVDAAWAAPATASAAAVIAAGRDIKLLNSGNAAVQCSAAEIVLKNSAGAAVLVTPTNGSPHADIALSGVAGLDTGAEASSTWYYHHVIRKTTPHTAVAVTADAGTDRVTQVAHGMAANSPVLFGGSAVPAGLTAGTAYFIRDVLTDTYKVSALPNGSAIDLTSAGTAVTVTECPAGLLSLSRTAPTLPAGYTYSAHVGQIRNDGSSNFVATWISDRMAAVADTNVMTATAVASINVYQSLSISAVVPPNAKTVGGTLGSTGTSQQGFSIAGSANLEGATMVDNWLGSTFQGFGRGGSFSHVPLITAQTVFWTSDQTAAVARINVSSYTF